MNLSGLPAHSDPGFVLFRGSSLLVGRVQGFKLTRCEHLR
jgi:hypothetical protein